MEKMPKFEANLQWMFNEYELLDRYDAAARAGFKGVELQAPYSAPVEQIVERLERNSLKHVIINSPVADFRGMAKNFSQQKNMQFREAK